jgi:hypothetical protein
MKSIRGIILMLRSRLARRLTQIAFKLHRDAAFNEVRRQENDRHWYRVKKARARDLRRLGTHHT